MMVLSTQLLVRVANTFSNFCCRISRVFYGEVENLPEPKRGTLFQQWYLVPKMQNLKVIAEKT